MHLVTRPLTCANDFALRPGRTPSSTLRPSTPTRITCTKGRPASSSSTPVASGWWLRFSRPSHPSSGKSSSCEYRSDSPSRTPPRSSEHRPQPYGSSSTARSTGSAKNYKTDFTTRAARSDRRPSSPWHTRLTCARQLDPPGTATIQERNDAVRRMLDVTSGANGCAQMSTVVSCCPLVRDVRPLRSAVRRARRREPGQGR